MKRSFALFLALSLFPLSGCQSKPVCPPRTGAPQMADAPTPAATAPAGPSLSPVWMEIGGRTIPVDEVVDGPLCDDAWSGTVYVGCGVQVKAWEEHPTFLKGCDLSIAPGSVVYVAYHNNAGYYNGCSCHTGEIAEP